MMAGRYAYAQNSTAISDNCGGCASDSTRDIGRKIAGQRVWLAHDAMNSIGKETILRARQVEMFAQCGPFVVASKQATTL